LVTLVHGQKRTRWRKNPEWHGAAKQHPSAGIARRLEIKTPETITCCISSLTDLEISSRKPSKTIIRLFS
jgi:hypothetical protein